MLNFRERLYESLLFSFGKILAKYNIFAQDSILKDVGKEVIEYLKAYGFEFKETDSLDDLSTLIELFCRNGFVDELEIEPAEVGAKYIWKNIYGFDAYRELLDVSENPFLSCPLNASLYYLADKHNKTLKLHKKSFDIKSRVAESQEEIVDKERLKEEGLDSLVVENARLYELAEERANKLQKALDEIKVLRGLLPICSHCKKIRDEAGRWRQFEVHIREHSEAEFSHCICPDCAKELYPEIYGNKE